MAARNSTWGLLPAQKLPNAVDIHEMLGSIILDFRNPQHDTLPPNNAEFMRTFKDHKAKPTADSNFRLLMSRNKSGSAFARLGDILEQSFWKSRVDEKHLETQKVRTYWTKNPKDVFVAIKKSHKAALDDLVAESRRRGRPVPLDRPGTLYMIIGIKTCYDATLKHNAERSAQCEVKGKVPVDKLVQATSGTSGPGKASELQAGGTFDYNARAGLDATFEGERIFAIECQLIMTVRHWKRQPPFTVSKSIEMRGPASMPNGVKLFGLDVNDARDLPWVGEDEDELIMGPIEYTSLLRGVASSDVHFCEIDSLRADSTAGQ